MDSSSEVEWSWEARDSSLGCDALDAVIAMAQNIQEFRLKSTVTFHLYTSQNEIGV